MNFRRSKLPIETLLHLNETHSVLPVTNVSDGQKRRFDPQPVTSGLPR
jgi:hypothetical protein